MIKTKKIMVLFAVLLCLLSGCGKKEEKPPAPPEEETITLVAVGDNLLHMPVVNSGKKQDGSYEYSHLFAQLQPAVKNADLAVIGQETVFGGADLGYSGYPLFNSPSDMGKSLTDAGFDVVLHASNHVLDKGVKGVENTLDFWETQPQTTVLGIHDSQKDKDQVKIVKIKGAKLALLNYTYGTNGISLPKDKGYMVSYIDEGKIKKDVAFAEQNADFTIAFMHWGTEYSFKPDQAQKDLCKKMCSMGVDLIIGSHPHVIEPVEWYTDGNGNKMLVYYSLGNFVSRQKEAKNLVGGMANVSLVYNGKTVSVQDYAFVPIVTHYDTEYKTFGVYPLKNYTNDLAYYHGVALHDGPVSVERFSGVVQTVFSGYDTECLDY